MPLAENGNSQHMVDTTRLAHEPGLCEMDVASATQASRPEVGSPQSSQTDNSQISRGDDAKINVQDVTNTNNFDNPPNLDPDQNTSSEPFIARLRECNSGFTDDD